jgi:flavorubredoxin
MGGRGGAPEKLAEDLTECGFQVKDRYEIYYVPDRMNWNGSVVYQTGKKLRRKLKSFKYHLIFF